jgi:hypothetical protein
MPEKDEAKNTADEKAEIVSTSKTDELPPITPPQTKTPITFNQQINYQQIPPSAWDGLTPEQRMELSKAILEKMDSMDERHYNFAVRHVDIETKRGTIRAVCGTLIALLGFGLTAYLALHGQVFVGLTISLPLATIIAIVVGSRFVGRL